MKYINNFLIGLHVFILSPIFPLFLAIILMLVYKICFDSLSLCDNGSSPLLLDQLKNNLSEETKKCVKISMDFNDINDVIQETRQNSNELSLAQRDNFDKMFRVKEMLIKSLNKNIDIELSIKKIDPNFTSGSLYYNSNMVRFLEENRR